MERRETRKTAGRNERAPTLERDGGATEARKMSNNLSQYELHPLCTLDRLKAAMRYCESTGVFTRLSAAGRLSAGAECGWQDRHGHVRITLDRRTYGAHRLAVFYVSGRWPEGEVDHINGVRSDNRIANLRDVPHAINLQNRRTPARHNKSGVLGVTKRGNSYLARIKTDGQQRCLGSFPSAAEAHRAYLAAKRLAHKGCTL